MCKAHVLRFRCGHGVLMALMTCRLGPCPTIKTTGAGLPQQPSRCYNCQHKVASLALRPVSSRNSSSSSSIDSLDSLESSPPSSLSSSISPTSTAASWATHPLPGVVVQPRGTVSTRLPQPSSTSNKLFTFSCHGSDHYTTPHYTDLPGFLPHQDHPCPPCQLQSYRTQADYEAVHSARTQFPSLRAEMLVHDGRTWDPETMTKPSLEQYVEEKRIEEREMWVHVTRKWTQDLKKARVLVAEEDGLGLFG